MIKHVTMALMLAAAGLTASAQESRVDVGGALAFTSGHTMKQELTNNSLGFGLEAGWRSLENRAQVPFRLGATVMSFPGKERDGAKNSLTLFQANADVFLKTPLPNTQFFAGVSLNRWRVTEDFAGKSETMTVKGWKMGYRFGLEATLNNNLSAYASLQLVEFGLVGERRGDLPANPTWTQVGVRYQF